MAEPLHRINWTSVKQRIGAAAKATEAAMHPSPDRMRLLLAERAKSVESEFERALSGEMAAIVRFSLNDVRYAIPAPFVREVLPLPPVTPMPRTPAYVVGIMDLRGHVLGLFDLRKLLGLPEGMPDMNPRVLVCGKGSAEIALLVDDVSGVDRMPSEEMRSALAESQDSPAWMRGRDTSGSSLIDGTALLEDERLFIG